MFSRISCGILCNATGGLAGLSTCIGFGVRIEDRCRYACVGLGHRGVESQSTDSRWLARRSDCAVEGSPSYGSALVTCTGISQKIFVLMMMLSASNSNSPLSPASELLSAIILTLISTFNACFRRRRQNQSLQCPSRAFHTSHHLMLFSMTRAMSPQLVLVSVALE
jgi:hypothetical protein